MKQTKSLVENFARLFTGKNLQEARKELNSNRQSVRSKDLIPMCLFAGINFSFVFIIALLLVFPNQGKLIMYD